jgi:hypothetical protein
VAVSVAGAPALLGLNHEKHEKHERGQASGAFVVFVLFVVGLNDACGAIARRLSLT